MFEMGCQPTIHGFLLVGTAKLSSNISLLMLPPSQKPTSRATRSALSSMCAGSLGSVQSLFTSCSLRCFASRGTCHLMKRRSRSSSVSLDPILLARNSRSFLNAFILQHTKYSVMATEHSNASLRMAKRYVDTLFSFLLVVLFNSIWNYNR